MIDFKQQLQERVMVIEEILNQYLLEETGYQKTVIQAMNYTLKAGGKRIRPLLMSETYKKFGGTEKVIEPFMAAIEMIHTYSLVHDDLPALDNDDYRRGRKTAHIVYGEDMAILAGDALLNYAFEVASTAFSMKEGDVSIGRAFQVLASKPGIHGMIGGQTADVELTGKPLTLEQILFIHRNKTGALLEASMMIGAILAGAKEEDVIKIQQIGSNIGLAFQIEDDILDIIGTEEEIGKPVNSDERNGKTTYVSLKGMEQAKEDVKQLTKEAITQLSQIGTENTFLTELLQYLINRTH